MIIFVKLSEYLLQTSSDKIINSYVVRSEEINVICHGANFKIKNIVKFVYLFWFLLKGRGSELGNLFLAHQTLWKLWNYLQSRWIDEIFLAIDYL